MKPFSELSRRAKLIEVLRWLGVLPAALLADFAVLRIVGAVFAVAHLVGSGRWGTPGDSGIAYPLSVLLYYVPRQLAFVVAGAKVAPRHQTATAIVLTGLGIFVSLMTHVVGQHLAGNRVGTTNYTHFLAESAGLLSGAGCLLWRDWRKCRADRGGVSRPDR
jgi:hypothetical protein